MENPDVIKRLERLTPRKREILNCFCRAMSIKQIAEKYFITEGSVRAHINQIYIKLELDLISVDARRAVLLRLYCEVFEKYVKGSEYKGKTAIVDLSPESFEEEAKEAEEELTPEEKEREQEIDDQVDADHKALIKIPPLKPERINAIEPVPQRDESRRRINPFQVGLFIFALIGFAAVAILAYEFLSGRFSIVPAREAAANLENQQEPVAMQPTQAPAEAQGEPTQAIIQPTNTAMQPTALPTPEPTSPPKPAILFEDDFESGLLDAWEVVSGNPIVVNGTLSTDQDTWLLVGDPGWENYSIEFRTNSPVGWTAQGFNALGVRAETVDNMYAYKWAEYDSECFILKNGDWVAVPQTDFVPGREEKTYRFTIEDDLFTVYMNGQKRTSFFDKRYSNGRIALKLFADTFIDDFKVREILE